MRYFISLLALAGVMVSTQALRVHYSTETEPCSINQEWDCYLVNHSPYAEVEGIPVAAIGIGGYLALAGLAFTRQRTMTFLASLVGLGIALYFAHNERDILTVWCQYSVISLGIVALLALLSLWWTLAWGLRSWYKERRAERGGG
jgi:vitamin-K-epoxide reductase (warfarin-sensitive)